MSGKENTEQANNDNTEALELDDIKLKESQNEDGTSIYEVIVKKKKHESTEGGKNRKSKKGGRKSKKAKKSLKKRTRK